MKKLVKSSISGKMMSTDSTPNLSGQIKTASVENTLETTVSNAQTIYNKVESILNKLKNHGNMDDEKDSYGSVTLLEKAHKVRELQNLTESMLNEIESELFA